MLFSLLALLSLSVDVLGADILTRRLLSPSTSPGGRCADGTMAGYYLQNGTDPDLYVIYLEGGGACYDEATCKARTKGDLGSSRKWSLTMEATSMYSADCVSNPDFCHATHVFVPYCTGDCHGGNNTSPSAKTWGLYFDGHANFAAIIRELKGKHGLNEAKQVLLAGGSAGGIGTFKNIDYLASHLPGATVKGAPNAGWFFPAALPGDLPNVYPPSDWAHFSAGTHGNPSSVNGSLPTFIHDQLWQDRGLMPPACVAAQKPDEWWACGSVDKLYRYIKSSLYVSESQYDTNQIYAQEHVPKQPTSTEIETVRKYVIMYGQAMRNSTAQVLNNEPITKKAQPDGIFHVSCLVHGTSDVTISGHNQLPILGDWFFERNQLTQYHRLVEHCPDSAGGLPCNPGKHCSFNPVPPAPGGSCETQLKSDGCLDLVQAAAVNNIDQLLPIHAGGPNQCEKCAQAHKADLEKAGCTTKEVIQLCS